MFTKKQLTAIKHIAAKGTKAEGRTTHCTVPVSDGKFAAVNNYVVVLFESEAFDDGDMDAIKADHAYFYNERLGDVIQVECLFANFNDYMANGDNKQYCNALCEPLTPNDVDKLYKEAAYKAANGALCIIREFGDEPLNNVTRFAVNAKYFRDACHAVGGRVFVNWSMNGVVVSGFESGKAKAIIMPVRL